MRIFGTSQDDLEFFEGGACAPNYTLCGSGMERALSVDNIKPEVCRAYNKGFGYDGIPGENTPVSDYPSA